METRTYNVTIGTDQYENEALAVARATTQLREGWIQEIAGVTIHGGGDQQIGVSLEVVTIEPPEVFEEYAETVEVVA